MYVIPWDEETIGCLDFCGVCGCWSGGGDVAAFAAASGGGDGAVKGGTSGPLAWLLEHDLHVAAAFALAAIGPAQFAAAGFEQAATF